MKLKFNSSTVLHMLYVMLAVTTISPLTASADSLNVLLDQRGNPVQDARGNCVRTNQIVPIDLCTDNCVTPGETVVIHFGFDQSHLTEHEKEKLRMVVNDIQGYNVTNLDIRGYADKIGNADYNTLLSFKRAESVQKYLGTLMSLDNVTMEIIGAGSSSPVKDCPDAAHKPHLIKCLAPNRRVELNISYGDQNS